MDDSSILQYIFLIAGILLTFTAMLLIVLKKGYRILGVLMLIVASLYIGMWYSLLSMQNELDKLDYEAAKQFISHDSTPKSIIGNSVPIQSKSTKPSKFLNIPVMPIQKINIPLASSSTIRSKSNANLKLTASVDNPNTRANSTVNVLVNGAPGTTVNATATYETIKTSHSGIIGTDGTVKIPFTLTQSIPDSEAKKVDVNVVGTLNDKTGTTQTYFIVTN